jgi:hypothetical protein
VPAPPSDPTPRTPKMSTTTTQLQEVAIQPFNHLAEEIIYTILSFLLAREEPIHIGICLVDPPFSDILSLLRVSRSFHRIAEHILYRSNTFEVWNSDIFLFDFLATLSVLGRRTITKLRIQWPDPSCSGAPDEILELIASCEGLKRVEFFHFPEKVALSDVRKIAFLLVEDIWFQMSTCHPHDLTIFGEKESGPRAREQMVSI